MKEEKLRKLLEIAVKNGWKDERNLLQDLHCLLDKVFVYVDGVEFVGSIPFINDLIVDFVEGEVSFLDALSIASKGFKVKTCAKYPVFVRQQWVLRPTYERLDWLFETFNHLLQ